MYNDLNQKLLMRNHPAFLESRSFLGIRAGRPSVADNKDPASVASTSASSKRSKDPKTGKSAKMKASDAKS